MLLHETTELTMDFFIEALNDDEIETRPVGWNFHHDSL